MVIQIEVKFLSINVDEVRQKLQALPATLKEPMALVKSAIIDFDDSRLETKQGRVFSIKNQNGKPSINFKEILEDRPGGIKTTEMVVDSFDRATELLEEAGLKVHSFQESRKETWQAGNTFLVINEWPWLKPYLEIIGPTEVAVRDISARIGLPWTQAVFGNTTLPYAAEYPEISLENGEKISQIQEMKFGASLPAWLKERQAK